MSNESLFVRELGAGSPVLLLGGCPTPAEHLLPLAEALARDHRVLLPDLPGYGKSPWPDGEYTLARAQAILEDALAARGVTELGVFGLSLGGYRALALACSPRLRVTAVMTVGGFANLEPEVRAGFTELAQALRGGADLRAVLAARMFSPAYAAAHPAELAAVERWLDLLPPAHLAAELDAVTRCPDLTGRLPALTMPIRARVGALDAATPPRYSEEIARLAPHATAEVVPGRGHLLLLEDTAATLASAQQLFAGR